MNKAVEAQARVKTGAVRSMGEAGDIEAQDFATATREHRAKVIIARCAQRHGVSVEDILGRSRRAPLVAARYAAMALVARVFPSYSTPQLGQLFGGRDHTSILWALGRSAKAKAQAARRNGRCAP